MRPSAPRLAMVASIAPLITTAVLSGVGTASAAAPRVLLVGTFNHIPGQFTSIQAAVDAAHPGDVILVGPGDYKEKGHAHPAGKEAEDPTGVAITTPGITLRGMDRNAVVVDGTKAGAPTCSNATADQDLGPAGSDGNPAGRNGIVDFGASGVAIENLTVCNYLSSASGGQGNEIWWNFGDGSGKATKGITFSGQYLTATATYFKDVSSPMGMYGIFTSNADADPAHPAVITQTYASNMGDSAYYIGACDDCNQVLDHATGVHSALGFSGTNAGGRLRIQNGEWYDNQSGIVPNALNNDDAPPPPDGGCPGAGGAKPLGSHCTIIIGNHVHDNNDPNVPSAGIAGAAPVGTGIELSGTRNDLVTGNLVERQGSWGILLHDYPDTETPPAVSQCQGGIPANQSQSFCYFQSFANEVRNNLLRDNGYFGNPSNSDLADVTTPNAYANCFHGNRHDDGQLVSSDPPAIQTLMGTCGAPGMGDTTVLLAEVVCASGAIVPCPNLAATGSAPITYYPRRSTIFVRPVPTDLPTMPDPCAGVPANPWCGGSAQSGATTTSAGVLGQQSGSASVVLGPSALPMTSGSPAPAGAVALLGGAMLAPAALAMRRRRRRHPA